MKPLETYESGLEKKKRDRDREYCPGRQLWLFVGQPDLDPGLGGDLGIFHWSFLMGLPSQTPITVVR